MLDAKGFEGYLRTKIDLEKRLSEVGDMPGNLEIKNQIDLIEERLVESCQRLNHWTIW